MTMALVAAPFAIAAVVLASFGGASTMTIARAGRGGGAAFELGVGTFVEPAREHAPAQ